MDAETTKALMAEELHRIRSNALSRAFGWEIESDGLVALVRLRPRRRKDRTYLFRATFEEFPRRAPSCVFVDPETRQPGDAAWPPGVRHGSEPPGIRTPGTREFHEHYHRGDQQYPWERDRYPFLQTLAEIHRMADQGAGG